MITTPFHLDSRSALPTAAPHATATVDGEFLVQMRPFPCASSPAFEAAWRDLERRSLLRNPFLSSSFLLPQQKAPEATGLPQLLTIQDAQGRWLIAGLFERVRGTRQLPLPHLRAVRMEHAFKTGMLIDATLCEEAVDALWHFLRQMGLHGISFPLFPIRSSLACLLSERCEREQLATTVDDLHERAMVTVFEDDEEAGISAKRAKSLRRGRRFLEKQGQVAMRFQRCTRDDTSAVERFLYLESLGWKGDQHSALACEPSEAQAFHRVALGLSEQDRIHFAELMIDERVIASMCLLRSQTDYYAFKVGWDPQFERGCPGFLLAHDIRQMARQLPHCERIDSCARPGSFLDHVWSERKAIGTALFTTTRWGSMAAHSAAWVRNSIRQWRQPPSIGPTVREVSDTTPEMSGAAE